MLLLLLHTSALASTVWPVGDRWLVEQWQTTDGLPMQHLNGLEIGPDGRLWLATYGGLLSFDGQRFESIGVGIEGGVHSPRVLDVAREPGTDALWVGFVDGRLERHTADGVTLFEPAGKGGPSLASDGEQLWLAAGTEALFVLEDAPREVARFGEDLQVLEVAPDGALWMTNATQRQVILDPDSGQVLESDQPAPMLWSGPWTSDRLTLWHDGDEVLVVDEGIRDLRWDGASLWVATGAGLLRVRERPVDVVLPPEGLDPVVDRLWWDPRNQALWARSSQVWWSVAQPDARLAPSDVNEPPWPGTDPLPPNALPIDTPSGLWWGTQGVVQAVDPATGLLEPLEGSPRFWTALASWQDASGRVWLGDTTALRVHDSLGWTALVGDEDQPLLSARSFVALPDGSTVVGVQGGVVWVDAAVQTVRGPLAPFPVTVRHVRLDPAGLWLATEERGLCVVPPTAVPDALGDTETWRCLNQANGLGTYGVHVSIADRHGRIWVSANRGLGWAEVALLQAFAAGETTGVPFTWLDEQDGLLSAEANGHTAGAAVAGPDGSLWFPTQRGAARLHPDRVRLPDVPSLRVTRVTVAGTPTTVPVQVHNPDAAVTVSWAGTSLAAPEQVVYRHRMGSESAWSPASATRSVILEQLAPGQHHLEIQAGLADQWGPATLVTIQRHPTLWERPATRGLAAILAVLGLGVAVQLRLRAGQRREAELGRRVNDATQALDQQNATLKQTTEQLRAMVAESAAQTERLQKLDQAKQKLLANVSHELRTPISLIIGPLGVLAERLGGDDLEAVQLALRNGERLNTLVGQLLDLARSSSGMMRLQAQRVALGARIAALVQRFPAMEDDRALTLQLCHPDPMVWCDPDMLDTIVGNLVANAREHGAGSVHLQVELEDESPGQPAAVRVSVQDEGPGLPPDGDDLFERFHQAVPDGGRGGLGLGLALVRELVELHGGEVDARNADGAGAVFSFTLPLGVQHLGLDDISVDTVPEPEPAPAEPEPSHSGHRVLLVEDNAELRTFLRSHLAGRYAVWAVETAEEGLDLLRREAFDLLVSDIMLPGISGLELVQRLRSDGNDLPVLIISAKGDVADRVEGLAVADDYLAKPFQMRELLARCAALLRRSVRVDAGTEEPEPHDHPSLTQAQSEFLARLKAAADERLADTALDLETLARAVGVSKRSLHDRLADLGLPSPGAWLRERRLDRAEALIDAGAFETVGEVAAAVGLSRAYFSRAFKARTGVSPGSRLGRR